VNVGSPFSFRHGAALPRPPCHDGGQRVRKQGCQLASKLQGTNLLTFLMEKNYDSSYLGIVIEGSLVRQGHTRNQAGPLSPLVSNSNPQVIGLEFRVDTTCSLSFNRGTLHHLN